MQGKDPKHTSRSTLEGIGRNAVNWGCTLPESPVSCAFVCFVLWRMLACRNLLAGSGTGYLAENIYNNPCYSHPDLSYGDNGK